MVNIALRRGIEVGLTWKVGFVMAVIPGMNFIHEITSADPCQGDYEMVLGRWQGVFIPILINGWQ